MQNGGNEKFSYILRTVAGVYLIYLSYKILSAAIKGETGNHTTLVTICAVIFILLGAVLIVMGVRGMIQMSKETQQETDEEEARVSEVEAEEVQTETNDADGTKEQDKEEAADQ